jgi:hypothetical protein
MDPDPGVPKTYGSYGSGSATLVTSTTCFTGGSPPLWQWMPHRLQRSFQVGHLFNVIISLMSSFLTRGIFPVFLQRYLLVTCSTKGLRLRQNFFGLSFINTTFVQVISNLHCFEILCCTFINSSGFLLSPKSFLSCSLVFPIRIRQGCHCFRAHCDMLHRRIVKTFLTFTS